MGLVEDLLKAATEGDTETVKTLAAAGAGMRWKSDKGYSRRLYRGFLRDLGLAPVPGDAGLRTAG